MLKILDWFCNRENKRNDRFINVRENDGQDVLVQIEATCTKGDLFTANSTVTVSKEMFIRTMKLRKICTCSQGKHAEERAGGTKTATEYELRLQHCGPLTT